MSITSAAGSIIGSSKLSVGGLRGRASEGDIDREKDREKAGTRTSSCRACRSRGDIDREKGGERERAGTRTSSCRACRSKSRRRRRRRGARTWEKQVLSARFKGVGRHAEYSIYAVWRCIGRDPGGLSDPSNPVHVSVSPRRGPVRRQRRVQGLLRDPRQVLVRRVDLEVARVVRDLLRLVRLRAGVRPPRFITVRIVSRWCRRHQNGSHNRSHRVRTSASAPSSRRLSAIYCTRRYAILR